MDYIELTIHPEPRNPWTDILIAELADLGFDSFTEDELGLQAYRPYDEEFSFESLITQTSLKDQNVQLKHSVAIIEHQNWNAQWEADFEPVLVKDQLAILAPFHPEDTFSVPLKVIIQPQMSFGTGHHQTTYLMSEYCLEMNPMPRKVLDVGTGTGVLAILAEKLGADYVLATEIEPWSVENTKENAVRNACTRIEAVFGDIDVVKESDFDLILANINKNVLKAHLPAYAKLMKQGAILCLSGFFVSDIDEIVSAAQSLNIGLVEIKDKETWASIRLQKL